MLMHCSARRGPGLGIDRRGTVNGQFWFDAHDLLNTSSTEKCNGNSVGDGGAENRFGEVGDVGGVHTVPVRARWSVFSFTDTERRNFSRRVEQLLDIPGLLDRE